MYINIVASVNESLFGNCILQETFSDDENDYVVGFNTADRVRRLSGLYTPRPFVASEPITGCPASAASHLHRPASAGLIPYNVSTDVHPDKLTYVANDRVLVSLDSQ